MANVFVEEQTLKDIANSLRRNGVDRQFKPSEMPKGIDDVFAMGDDNGYHRGHMVGYNSGYDSGYSEGYSEGMDKFAIKPTVAGESIVVDDSIKYKPLAMTVFGKSWQDDTPTLDSPQEIHSHGSDGSIEYNVYGGNLIDQTKATIFKLSTNVWVNDAINISYAISKYGRIVEVPFHGKKGETYYFSYNVTKNTTTSVVRLYFPDISQYSGGQTQIGVRNDVVKLNDDVSKVGFYIDDASFVEGTEVLINDVIFSKINIPYEPYKAPQSLVLQSPNGLKGVPVSSGGNYTDSNGQQYVADYIDLKNGELVQNIAELIVGEGSSLAINGNTLVTNGYASVSTPFTDIANNGSGVDGLCNRFVKGSGWKERYNLAYRTAYFWISAERLNGENTTLADVKEYVKNNPIKIYAVRSTPIKKKLTNDEIIQYLNLKMNEPSTTILNDANAYTSVHYIADTERYLNNLTNAILTVGGNV